MVMEDPAVMVMAVLTMKRDLLLLNIQVTMPLEAMVMEDPAVMVMAVLIMKRDLLLLNIQVTMPLEVMVMEDPVDMDMEVLTMRKDLQRHSLVMDLLMFMLSKRIMVMDIQSPMSMAIISTKDQQRLGLAIVTPMAQLMFILHKPIMDMAIQNPTAMVTASMVNVR